MNEWKDIPGYEGIYQASIHGDIRTAPGKTTYTQRHGVRTWKTRIMKGRGDSPKTGRRVGLWKDGICKDWLVARLVALTWVDGFSEGMTVNHINGNRLDNNISNLEWVTLAENIRHGYETGLYKNNMKPVKVKCLLTGTEKKFVSMSEASRFLDRRASFVSDLLASGRNTYQHMKITKTF